MLHLQSFNPRSNDDEPVWKGGKHSSVERDLHVKLLRTSVTCSFLNVTQGLNSQAFRGWNLRFVGGGMVFIFSIWVSVMCRQEELG